MSDPQQDQIMHTKWLPCVLQVVKTLKRLSLRLASANKDAVELDELRAEVHRQLLKTNFLPASLQLAEATAVSACLREMFMDACVCVCLPCGQSLWMRLVLKLV